MTPEFAIEIVRHALMMAFWLSAPLLVAAFATGIIVSLIQIVTSIQDSAFGTIPRLAACLGAIIIAMPWMVNKVTLYTTQLLGELGRYAR